MKNNDCCMSPVLMVSTQSIFSFTWLEAENSPLTRNNDSNMNDFQPNSDSKTHKNDVKFD